MLGNMGIAEWGIVSVITLLFFGAPAALLILLLMRRREPVRMTPPSPSDQAQMQRILDSLERMERRIENLETVIGQRPESGETSSPR